MNSKSTFAILQGTFILFVCLQLSCQSSQKDTSESMAPTLEEAQALAQKIIIVDTHVDVPYRLHEQELTGATADDISEATETGDFDYVRAKAGGLNAPFFAIYVPAEMQTTGNAQAFADSLIDKMEIFIQAHPDKFAFANSPADVREQFSKGLISIPMGMENGAPMDKIENIAYFKNRGIHYVTLTHSANNLICDSSYDTTRLWNGLSPYGEKVVKEMNRVGMMVDISHVSDSTFYDVIEISTAPVIASHSSARYFTPGFERNMSDDMIKTLAENGGVIQINFGSSFLDEECNENFAELKTKMFAYMEENGGGMGSPGLAALIQEYAKEHKITTDYTKIADHIDHVVDLVGIDHVGLGSDFDGVGPTLPEGMKDPSQLPNLILELMNRGYSEEDIEKICSGNILRVWGEIQAQASAS